MTIIGLIMFLAFGFLTIRHAINGRYFWAIMTAFGCLLGAASIWVDYERAANTADPVVTAAEASPSANAPVIRDYKPPAEDKSEESTE